MPTKGTDKHLPTDSLLSSDEPTPFAVLNDTAASPVLLVCDHASRRFPQSLGTMGLDPVARRSHLALDIGAGALTRQLAVELQVTAVLCEYSRLVVDCNRQLMDPGAFLEFGDGVIVPGNRALHAADKASRANEIYWPYHGAIDAQIKRLQTLGVTPIFVSIHSFTPVLNGDSRSWEMGVLWDVDRATAEIFVHDLRKAGYLVGDNEPYSGKAPQDFTIDHHGESAGLPHVGIEIRQDLIDNEAGLAAVAKAMHAVIESLPARVIQKNINTQQSPKTA